MGILSDGIEWLTDPANWEGTNGIPARLLEHLQISVVSMAIALAIALPMALVLGHLHKGEFFVNAAVNIGRAIPSFGIVIFAGLLFLEWGISLKFWPVVAALVLLAIPPIFTNTYTAITTVDPELVEAARGVGMPERRVLLSLELPVSAPVTLAGIKIATVQVVSTATIGAILSSGGGFGRYIVDGFGQGPPGHAKVLGGAVLLAGLVLVIESIFALAERRLLPEGIRRLGRATDVVDAIGHG